MQFAQLADNKPAGIHIDIFYQAFGFVNCKCAFPAVAEQVFAVFAGFEFSAIFEKIAVALECGYKMKATLPTTFDNHGTQIVTVKQHMNANTFGRLKFTDKLGGQLRGLFELNAKRLTILFFDVKPNPKRNGMALKADSGRYILMASDISACKRVANPSDRLHCLASFLIFGVIDNQFDRLAFGGVQVGE